jgi:V/A-type H+-transporting ATPase subunit E
MSLGAILEAIKATGDARVAEIELRTRTRANELLVNAQEEVQRIQAAAREAALAPAVAERARIIHQARLDSLQLVGNVREALVDTALDRARGCLANLRADPAYRAIMHRLVEEALCGLDVPLEDLNSARLEADPRDQGLLADILQEIGLEIQVGFSLNCWGGLVVKSEDGRVVVINTLESRLERATPFLRQYLAALFQSQHHEYSRFLEDASVKAQQHSAASGLDQ